MKTFICPAAYNLRDFTDCVFPQASFCFSRLLRDKDIKINGARVGKNVPLKRGDEVVYYTTPKEEALLSHNTIFDGQSVYIADKFSGVSTEGLCSELNTGGVFYPVHRLDRNTAGVIVFAKTKGAEEELKNLFKSGLVKKVYHAVCKNNFFTLCGVLRGYILKDEARAMVKVLPSPQKGALTAVTAYAVEKAQGELALVKVILHTGRTHQIRAQMAYNGSPVLGDCKYGDAALNKKYSATRQRLVASSLKFPQCGGELAEISSKKFVSGINLTLPPV